MRWGAINYLLLLLLKGKTQPPLHPPPGRTGRQPPTELKAKGRTGMPTYMFIRQTEVYIRQTEVCIRQTEVLSVPELPSTESVGLSLLFRHLCLPNDRNGSRTDNDGSVYSTKTRSVVSRQSNDANHTICITRYKLDYYAKSQRGKHTSNPWGNTYQSIIGHHFQLWNNTESLWVGLFVWHRTQESFKNDESAYVILL